MTRALKRNLIFFTVYFFTFVFPPLEEVPPPPRPPPPSVEVNVPPRPPPPAEVPMDASVVEMLQRPPEDNRIAVSSSAVIYEL